jgi:hypothetical protein
MISVAFFPEMFEGLANAKVRMKGLYCLGLQVLLLVPVCTAFSAIPYRPGGTDLLTFDTRPLPSDGWTTLSLAGANTDIPDAVTLDAFVQRVEARSITNALGQSTTLSPSQNSFSTARWNSVGHYLQTKPVGNAGNLLMATVQNLTGSDMSSIILSYDFGALVEANSTITETVPGQRLYYSLTGDSNSWVNIGQLTTSTQAFFCFQFSNSWEAGSLLYLLWADDNGIYSDTGAATEGEYTIDNLNLAQASIIPSAVAVTQQPHNAVVEEGRSTNFTVACSGSNLRYQWFKDGSPIPGATNNSLLFPAARLADAGSYFARITGIGSWSPCNPPGPPTTVDSATVRLTVNVDAENPVPIFALRLADGTNIIVSFSEAMDESSINKYTFAVSNPGSEWVEIEDVVLVDRTNVVITTAASPALANYTLWIDPSVSDTQGNGTELINVPIAVEWRLLSIRNTPWKYNYESVGLGKEWRADLNYDDSTWSNGLSVFDGNSTGRLAVNGEPVMTTLPLHSDSGDYAVDALPVYYFRTRFDLPTDPSQVADLRLRTMVDDYDVGWLNGYESPVYTNAGLAQTNLDTYGYSGGISVGTADFLPSNGYFHLDPTNLLFGQNLMAAKVFQVNRSNSDITFAYELTAIINRFTIPAVRLTIAPDAAHPGQWVIEWQSSAGQLYQAAQIDAPPQSWTPVNNASPGRYVIPTTGTASFYTLRQ